MWIMHFSRYSNQYTYAFFFKNCDSNFIYSVSSLSLFLSPPLLSLVAFFDLIRCCSFGLFCFSFNFCLYDEISLEQFVCLFTSQACSLLIAHTYDVSASHFKSKERIQMVLKCIAKKNTIIHYKQIMIVASIAIAGYILANRTVDQQHTGKQ